MVLREESGVDNSPLRKKTKTVREVKTETVELALTKRHRGARHKQTDRQADRQGRQEDRQGRQADRQADNAGALKSENLAHKLHNARVYSQDREITARRLVTDTPMSSAIAVHSHQKSSPSFWLARSERVTWMDDLTRVSPRDSS